MRLSVLARDILGPVDIGPRKEIIAAATTTIPKINNKTNIFHNPPDFQKPHFTLISYINDPLIQDYLERFKKSPIPIQNQPKQPYGPQQVSPSLGFTSIIMTPHVT